MGFSQLVLRPVGLVAIQSCGWTPTILPAVLVVRWFPRLGAAERWWKSNPESRIFLGIPLEFNFGVIGNRQKLGLWWVWSTWLVTMAGWTVFCISSRTFRCRLDFFWWENSFVFSHVCCQCHTFLSQFSSCQLDPNWTFTPPTLGMTPYGGPGKHWHFGCWCARTREPRLGYVVFRRFSSGFREIVWHMACHCDGTVATRSEKQWLQLRWLQLLCVGIYRSSPRFDRMQCIRTRSHAMFTCYPGTETQVIDASGQVSVELRQLRGGDPPAIQQGKKLELLSRKVRN